MQIEFDIQISDRSVCRTKDVCRQVTYPDNKSQTDSLFAQECFCILPLLLATNGIHLSDCHLRASEKAFAMRNKLEYNNRVSEC